MLARAAGYFAEPEEPAAPEPDAPDAPDAPPADPEPDGLPELPAAPEAADPVPPADPLERFEPVGVFAEELVAASLLPAFLQSLGTTVCLVASQRSSLRDRCFFDFDEVAVSSLVDEVLVDGAAALPLP